jgi:hypothetical protein
MLAFKTTTHLTSTLNVTRLWSAKEIADIARAFIDLDLDGPDLHKWCRDNGIDRTPGAIDKKLSDLNFFDDATPAKATAHAPTKGRAARTVKSARQCALANLQNQIKLAKLEIEAKSAPPYKPGRLEWCD